MVYEQFVGGTATLRSPNFNVEQTKNWYPEPSVQGKAKSPAALLVTPGLVPFVTLGLGVVRALFGEDELCTTVSGPGFWKVTANQQAFYQGPVADDGRPATISSNGTIGFQQFITAGGYGYIWNTQTETLSQIVDPGLLFPLAMGGFVDGYFVALKQASRQWQFSAIADGTTWDPLDVNEVSQASDNLRAMIINHRELWFLGSKTTTVWADVGDPLIPFQPIPGAFLEMGIAGEFAWARTDNGIIWLGANADGDTMVFRPNGYTPQQVSEYAIPYRLSQISTLADVICWSYQQVGHTFFLIYPPQGDTTFVLDLSTGLWHERNIWDPQNLVWRPHLGRNHAFIFGKHLVGDRRAPALYDMRLDAFTDTAVVIS